MLPTLQNHAPVTTSVYGTILVGLIMALAKKYQIDLSGLEPYLYALGAGIGFGVPRSEDIVVTTTPAKGPTQ
jgi:hypothetical protein